jgi:hypothetical protein
MIRWLATTALVGALVLSGVAGCGATATTGPSKGGTATSNGGKAGDGGKETPKSSGRVHDPG